MSELPRIYEWLASSDNAAADAALREALPRLESPFREYATRTLVRRGTAGSLLALIANHHVLSPELQAFVVKAACRDRDAIGAALHDPSAETRQNALAIVQAACEPRLAGFAVVGLHDPVPQVRQAASQTLCALVDRYFANDAAARSAPRSDVSAAAELIEQREAVVRALALTLDAFSEHHRPETLALAMYFAPDLADLLFSQSSSRRLAFGHAMLELYQESDDPRLAAFTYIAMTRPELRGPVCRRVESRCDSAFFHEMLKCAYLVRDPAIRRGMGHLRRLGWLASSNEGIADLPLDVLPAAPAWIVATGLPVEQKLELLTHLTLSDHPEAAVAAVCELARLGGHAMVRGLDPALRRGEPVVQRMAMRALKHRQRMNARMQKLVGLDQSARPGESIFESIWDAFERLDAASARALGRRLRLDLREFAIGARSRLASRSLEDRSRAVRLVAALGLASAFTHELAALSGDEDATIRATVMTALATAGGAIARRILERALLDADARVVANAVEGLDRLGMTRRVELILPLLEHADNRVRASAVRALLHRRRPEAARTLVQMLCDPRRTHRTSAIWLFERMRLMTIADRIRDMAASDPDGAVRRAATAALERVAHLAAPAPTAPAEAGA